MASAAAVAKAAKKAEDITSLRYRTAGEMPEEGAIKGGAANDLSGNFMSAAEAGFLTGAKDVKKVGTETVDGVRTTHYAGKVTLADVKAAAKGHVGRRRRPHQAVPDAR